MNDVMFSIVLDPPSPEAGPTYWVSKCGGDGPGWTISPSKKGRLKIPKHDAERILDRLPLVAAMKVELGWKPSVVRVGRKRNPRRPRRRRESAPRESQRPVVPDHDLTPVELLEQVEVLRLRAQKLCVESDMDSPAGYWVADLQSALAIVVRKGAQLLLGEEAPA